MCCENYVNLNFFINLTPLLKSRDVETIPVFVPQYNESIRITQIRESELKIDHPCVKQSQKEKTATHANTQSGTKLHFFYSISQISGTVNMAIKMFPILEKKATDILELVVSP